MGRSRANREGSVEPRRRRDGSVEFRVRVWLRGKRRVLGTFATEADAERTLAAWRDEVEAQGPLYSADCTVGDVVERFRNDRELKGSRKRAVVRDFKNECSIIRRHILPAAIARVPVRLLTDEDVEDFLRETARKNAISTVRTNAGPVFRESKRPLSEKRVAEVRRLLCQALDFAVRKRLVDRNVARAVGVQRDETREQAQAWTFLTQTELEMIEAKAVPEAVRLMVLGVIYTGARQAEYWRLKWADVDFDGGLLHIRRGANGGPKNGRTRSIQLLPMAAAVFRRLRKLNPTAKTDDYIFRKPGKDREPYATGYDAGWDDKRERRIGMDGQEKLVVKPGWCSRIGIARHVRFHDLRHYAERRIMPNGSLAAVGHRRIADSRAMLIRHNQRAFRKAINRSSGR